MVLRQGGIEQPLDSLAAGQKGGAPAASGGSEALPHSSPSTWLAPRTVVGKVIVRSDGLRWL